MEIKIVRRASGTCCNAGEAEFDPKSLETIKLHYARNRSFRLTREELKQMLAALQAYEYQDGLVRLIEAPSIRNKVDRR
jgi:hypothetical protein